MPKKKKHEVWIFWGEHGEQPKPSYYAFATLAELNAFLAGVDSAAGWLDYHQCDTRKDVAKYQLERSKT